MLSKNTQGCNLAATILLTDWKHALQSENCDGTRYWNDGSLAHTLSKKHLIKCPDQKLEGFDLQTRESCSIVFDQGMNGATNKYHQWNFVESPLCDWDNDVNQSFILNYCSITVVSNMIWKNCIKRLLFPNRDHTVWLMELFYLVHPFFRYHSCHCLQGLGWV